MSKNQYAVRIIALVLVFVTFIPAQVNAAVSTPAQPYASLYLNGYGAYVYLPGDGEVRVYFQVDGTGYMDELGALSIEIHESTDGINWDWVKTFNHDTTAGMLSYIDDYHSGYVSYDGVSGRYYKAYVCVWAGKAGQGDSRWFWTSAKH